jgi:putative membrane protein
MLLKNNIPLEYTFGKIKWEVMIVAMYAIGIAVLYNNFHFTRISIPLNVPMILGTVISLLLAFRSNQAYDRWWEARTNWGAIVNDNRSLTRQLLSFMGQRFEDEEIHAFQQNFVQRQMAWNYCLSQRLRGENQVEGLERLLNKRDLALVAGYDNAPTALLELHGRDLIYALDQGWINQFQQVEMDRTLTRLCDAMGRCERIKNTVFPATYSQYIHFAMNIFIIMLPFALIGFFGFMEVPIVIIISALFMLIEKMAIHLQDPFENKPTDTPMTTISRSIEKDLRQMLRDSHHSMPSSAVVMKGYYQL